MLENMKMKSDLYKKYDFDGLEKTINKNQYSTKSLNITPLKLKSSVKIIRNKRIMNNSVSEKPSIISSKKANYNTLTI
jgi:hypothetical protein